LNIRVTEKTEDAGWLVLIYRVPPEPTRLRSTVWRRIKSLGAIYLQNSAAALPASAATERALRKLRREIIEMSGTASSTAVLFGAGGRVRCA
jgi:DNA-binding transcriptional regulator PaaX